MEKMKKNIKIFVSNRIDLDSETIDNSLYVPVRCGAVYDKRENVTMIGDNTGENISELKPYYSELTVQYWAWKNVKADYYGLCHYRRYLSFASENFPTGDKTLMPTGLQNMVICENGNSTTFKKFGLMNEKQIYDIICNNDIIVANNFDVSGVVELLNGKEKNVYGFWKSWDGFLIEYKYVEALLELIKKYYPEYEKDVNEYMAGKYFLGFNCFVIKKELFFELCEFEFKLLFEMEKQINMENYTENMSRTMGFLGEILYSIWVYHKSKNSSIKLERRQLIFFKNIEKQKKWEIGNNNNSINVTLYCDDYEYIYFCVMFKSFLKFINKNKKYYIVIFHKNLKSEYINQIKNTICSIDNIVLDFCNINSTLYSTFNIPQNIASDKFNIIGYLPYILHNKTKCIFIDNNIIINGDISVLLDKDNEMFTVKAVKDIEVISQMNFLDTKYKKRAIEVLNLKNPYKFYNESLIVFDLENIRKNFNYSLNNINNVLDNYLIKTKENYNIAEMLNLLYEDDIQTLNFDWNFQCYDIEYSKFLLSFLPLKIKEEYVSNQNNEAQIYSYKSLWLNDLQNVVNKEKFWQYARLTKCYEELFIRMILNYKNNNGNENRIKNIFNKVFPINSMRRKIFRILFPKNSLQWNILKFSYKKLTK